MSASAQPGALAASAFFVLILYIGVIWGLYRNNGKEHGNYFIRTGYILGGYSISLYWGYMGVI